MVIWTCVFCKDSDDFEKSWVKQFSEFFNKTVYYFFAHIVTFFFNSIKFGLIMLDQYYPQADEAIFKFD